MKKKLKPQVLVKDHLTDDERFEQAWNLIVQFFPDAVLITRPKSNDLSWRTTDTSWAYGAITQYMRMLDSIE